MTSDPVLKHKHRKRRQRKLVARTLETYKRRFSEKVHTDDPYKRNRNKRLLDGCIFSDEDD